MTNWLEEREAAYLVFDRHDRLALFRKLLRNSDNPPPFVRPSSRTMLFDEDALKAWMQTWERVEKNGSV